jgi:hypothetical protein
MDFSLFSDTYYLQFLIPSLEIEKIYMWHVLLQTARGDWFCKKNCCLKPCMSKDGFHKNSKTADLRHTGKIP